MKLRKAATSVIALVLVLSVFPGGSTYAAGSCTVSVSPSTVAPASSTTFDVAVTNNGSDDLMWVDVTVPQGFWFQGNFNLPNDWGGSDHEGGSSISGGVLGQGQTINLSILASASVRNLPPGAWQILASTDAGGADPTACTGSKSTAIVGHPSTDAATGVSNVVVSNITTTSAAVTWDSDVATSSLVYYGATAGYGSASGYNASQDTSHSVVLSGLSAGTSYHFQVAGDDGQGAFAFSGDNTFVTTAAPASGTGGTGTGGTGAGGTGAGGTNGQPSESVAPTVSLNGDFSKPFKTVPRIEGRASDNVGVAKVEYSTDGGENWSAVDSMSAATSTQTTGRGRNRRTVTTTDTKSVSFAFTPLIRDDGNYVVMARVTDLSGNRGTSAPVTVIVDRLPPRFGTSVVMIGAQVIEPAADGTLVLPAGVDFRVTTSMVGGPTAVTLRAMTGKGAEQSFGLTPSSEAGLWVGVLSFSKAGRYQLVGEAVDGAANRTSREVLAIEVVPPVSIEGGSEEAMKKTVATLYYLNSETQGWAEWDAATYGQRNPLPLDGKRTLSLLVPAGKYYLKFATPGGLDTLTQSFTIDQATPLTGVVKLQRMAKLVIGPVSVPLPWTELATAPVKPINTGTVMAGKTGLRLPLVQLPTTTAGRTVSPADWYGKPTVVAALATWAPASAEQLGALARLSENPDLNVVVLANQQRPETVAAYLKIAGNSQEAVADPDGLLSDSLTTPGIPALYFVDRRGIIKKVMVGVRSEEVILNELSHL